MIVNFNKYFFSKLHQFDKEDVHDRSKWRRIVNVMKRKSNPIGKRTINR